MHKSLMRKNSVDQEAPKRPNTIDPKIAKLTKKLIKKYSKTWEELAKL